MVKTNMSTRTTYRIHLSALALSLLIATDAGAQQAADAKAGQQTHGGRSVDEIAAELQNPNTVLGSLTFNFDYIAFDGDLPDADKQEAWKMTFQPVLPYPLNKEEKVNFFLRPAIPIVFDQDVPTATGYDSVGTDLGDISFDAAIGKSWPNGWVTIGGVAGQLPTATDDALGKDQWILGPELILAHVGKKFIGGMLVSHTWDLAGDDDVDTNVTAGQYFYVFNLTNGWQIKSSPTWSYDHEAPNGERTTFPVGIGVNKTMILGDRPWKFGLEYWHYVEQADAFGPDWQVRFSVTPVVALPWGG